MSKYLVAAAALLALSACGSKPAATPAADTAAAAAPAPAAPTDSTKKADTTKVAGDTAKKPN